MSPWYLINKNNRGEGGEVTKITSVREDEDITFWLDHFSGLFQFKRKGGEDKIREISLIELALSIKDKTAFLGLEVDGDFTLVNTSYGGRVEGVYIDPDAAGNAKRTAMEDRVREWRLDEFRRQRNWIRKYSSRERE